MTRIHHIVIALMLLGGAGSWGLVIWASQGIRQ